MRIALTALLVLLSLASGALAQQPSQAQANAIRQSCRSDYQSYCASVPTGGAASLQCLQQHLGQLSQSCQTAVSAVGGASAGATAGAPRPAPSQSQPAMPPREEVALLRRACGRDYRALCAGVQPGGGRAVSCLMANEQRLSPACKGALAEAHHP